MSSLYSAIAICFLLASSRPRRLTKICVCSQSWQCFDLASRAGHLVYVEVLSHRIRIHEVRQVCLRFRLHALPFTNNEGDRLCFEFLLCVLGNMALRDIDFLIGIKMSEKQVGQFVCLRHELHCRLVIAVDVYPVMCEFLVIRRTLDHADRSSAVVAFVNLNPINALLLQLWLERKKSVLVERPVRYE